MHFLPEASYHAKLSQIQNALASLKAHVLPWGKDRSIFTLAKNHRWALQLVGTNMMRNRYSCKSQSIPKDPYYFEKRNQDLYSVKPGRHHVNWGSKLPSAGGRPHGPPNVTHQEGPITSTVLLPRRYNLNLIRRNIRQTQIAGLTVHKVPSLDSWIKGITGETGQHWIRSVGSANSRIWRLISWLGICSKVLEDTTSGKSWVKGMWELPVLF